MDIFALISIFQNIALKQYLSWLLSFWCLRQGPHLPHPSPGLLCHLTVPISHLNLKMEAGRWRYSWGKKGRRAETTQEKSLLSIYHVPGTTPDMLLYSLSGLHLWRRYIHLQLRKLKFWEMCVFSPPSSILGTGPTNYPAVKTETGSCLWSLLSNPLNLWAVNVHL